MTTQLILVRHGETSANTAGCFLGDLDVELNQDSIQPIHQLASSIGQWKEPIKVILSSPLQRAQQTAKIIANSLNINEVNIEQDLREMSFGLWEGVTSKEVASFDNEALLKWKERSPLSTTGPTNGETLKEVGDRVERILNQISEEYSGQTIVVVTHVYVIKAALDHCLELPDGYHANRLWLDTATATIMDWSSHPHKRTLHRVNWSPTIDQGASKWIKL